MIEKFNIALFRFLNNFSHLSIITDELILFFAVYLPYFLLVTLIVWVIFFKKTFFLKIKIVLECVTSAMLSVGVVVQIIRLFFYHLRPTYVINNIYPLFEEISFSFPSAHATFYFSISYIVFTYNKLLGSLFFIASVIICISRVIAGVHFPLDVLFGIVLGIFTSVFVHYLFRWFYFSKS